MFTFFAGIFAVFALIDLIYLIVMIFGANCAGIIEWVCYPCFGLLPLPLFTGLIVRICEGAAVSFFLGHLF